MPPKSSPPIAAEMVEVFARARYEARRVELGDPVMPYEDVREHFEDDARFDVAVYYPAIWNSFEEALLGEEAVHAAWSAIEELEGHPPVASPVISYAFRAALQAIRGEQGDG